MKGVWLFFVFSCMFLFLQAGTYRKREVSRIAARALLRQIRRK